MTPDACDSLGRAVPPVTPLSDNIRRQIAKMRAAYKQPRTLRISPLNWALLSGEIAQLAPFFPSAQNISTVFGLQIEFTPESKFEVVE